MVSDQATVDRVVDFYSKRSPNPMTKQSKPEQTAVEREQRIAKLEGQLEPFTRSMEYLLKDRGGCTEICASWCPKCGDCSCPRNEEGETLEESTTCGLHGVSSKHAEVIYFTDAAAAIVRENADLRRQLKKASTQLTVAEQKIDDFKSASLLVGSSGDPADIEPDHVEAEISGLRHHLKAVQTLHSPDKYSNCLECNVSWPCKTNLAAHGQDYDSF